jgi:hypothetical protein
MPNYVYTTANSFIPPGFSTVFVVSGSLPTLIFPTLPIRFDYCKSKLGVINHRESDSNCPPALPESSAVIAMTRGCNSVAEPTSGSSASTVRRAKVARR